MVKDISWPCTISPYIMFLLYQVKSFDPKASMHRFLWKLSLRFLINYCCLVNSMHQDSYIQLLCSYMLWTKTPIKAASMRAYCKSYSPYLKSLIPFSPSLCCLSYRTGIASWGYLLEVITHSVIVPWKPMWCLLEK